MNDYMQKLQVENSHLILLIKWNVAAKNYALKTQTFVDFKFKKFIL
jgi:hypothetical protein